MLARDIVSERYPLIVSILSLCFFLAASIAFLVVILVNNKLLDDGVFMSYHLGLLKSETFKIGVESPAVICLVASVVYTILSAISIHPAWSHRAILLATATDALIFPLLFCSLFMLNDLIQLIIVVVLYIIHKTLVYDMSITVVEFISFRVWCSAMLSILAILVIGSIGSYFNYDHIRRGNGLAQIITHIILSYDLYITLLKGQEFKHDISVRQWNRLVLLICVFTQEF